MDDVPLLHNEQVKALEAAIASGLNAQDADIALIVSETQVDINNAEDEIGRQKQIIIAKHAERERRIAAIHDAGRPRLEELQREVADLQHKLVVIASPILALPHEVTAEIFQWHTWIGGDLLILLLVCKRWTAIAYANPRLWSRISLSKLQNGNLGSLHCRGLNQLRLFLSRSQSSLLQIKIGDADYSRMDKIAPTSFWHKSLGLANRNEAIKLILNNEILGRCTSITFGYDPIPLDDSVHQAAVEAMTVLPLLSLISITASRLRKHELRVLHSLARCSPSLRHIRYHHWDMSPQELGAESWAKRIEIYEWVSASKLCHSLQESPSLRVLRIEGEPVVPLTLLAVQELRWFRLTFPGFPFIAAPQLRTLLADHARAKPVPPPPAGSIALPSLRIAIHLCIPDITVLRAFHTPALEHLSIQSFCSSPADLLQVFDGSRHMPTPKSLHLHWAFTGTALISILRRLPQLEELRVVGGIPQEAFWEALTPPCNLNKRSCALGSYLDARVTDILVPKLHILLVDNSLQHITLSDDDLKALSSKGGHWTVTQASAVAVARERAGCPLNTLACWCPERKVTVLIGSLESLPQRPKCVLFIALWCHRDLLMSYNDSWND